MKEYQTMAEKKSSKDVKKLKDAFADKPIAIPESIDMEKHLIATYWLKGDKSYDAATVGQILAIEQTTGTWTPVPGETPEIRAAHVAKVIGVYEAPYHEYGLPADVTERQYILQLAFPSVNVDDQFPMILTAVIGNISMVPNFKLLDIRFPKATLDQYNGPKFGPDGWWKVLGIKKDRPLLNNMIKPCSGYPLEVGARLFESGIGRCDVIRTTIVLICVTTTGETSQNVHEDRKRSVRNRTYHLLVNTPTACRKCSIWPDAAWTPELTASWSIIWLSVRKPCAHWLRIRPSMCPFWLTWMWRELIICRLLRALLRRLFSERFPVYAARTPSCCPFLWVARVSTCMNVS